MLPQDGWLGVLVWCACQRQDFADLQAVVDAGRGDVPIRDLKFRCTACGSRRTDFVVTSRSSSRVKPWRGEVPPEPLRQPVCKRLIRGRSEGRR
jgi:hypothetical protein